MSDPADQGNDAAELFLDIAKRNHKPPVEIHGIGICLNCGAAVEGEKRWCDTECRNDWEQANARR